MIRVLTQSQSSHSHLSSHLSTHPMNELRKYINNVSLLLLRNLGKTWQGQCLFGSSLSFRKLAVTVAQISKTFLEVKGNRIINFTADTMQR